MTLYGEPRAWLEQFPVGVTVPYTHGHGGLLYPGEVIRSDSWLPEWGRRLEAETYFRIVLLQQRRGGLRPEIEDSRIALCVPAAGLSRRRGRLAAELSTTRETQAVYLTQRDPEADLIRQTLQRRLDGLEEQLVSEDSVRYSEGQVLTGGDQGPDAASFFVGLDPTAWFSRLAGWLLTEAYPDLPLDQAALPRPVGRSDAAGVFRAVFGQPESPTDILAQLGPGLGLSLASTPAVFDPSSCRVLELIRRRLAGQSGAGRWEDVHQYLDHQVGLTAPLATLYLLVYLYCERPELAVDLISIHQITLVDGRPLLGTRLTPDLIPALVWNEGVSSWAQAIAPVADPQWNDAVPHLSALSPGLMLVEEGADFIPQERALLEHLGSLARELDLAREFLDLLGRAQELLGQIGRSAEGDPETPEMTESLNRLSRISGDDFQSVYHSIRAIYSDYRRLEADRSILRQMADLGRSILRQMADLGRFTEEILQAQEYLEGAALPSDRYPSLSVDRQALQAALSPVSLVESRGRNWDALSQDVSRFKSRFAAAYRTHHENVHQGLLLYRRELESAQRKLVALELLNTLQELGDPLGDGLEATLLELDPGPAACTVAAADLQLESTPWCGSCRLTLDQSLMIAQLTRLVTAIDVDLGAKNRQLSNLLVERIIEGQADERLEDFLMIVQASNLSALSNTLTPDMVTFIRGILS